MPDQILKITPAIPIPAFMVGEVQSKLAYVDESIEKAIVQPDGMLIDIKLKSSIAASKTDEITARVQEVVTLMVKGVIQPRTQVLENFLDRTVPCHTDPMAELLERREVFQEGRGIYTLGPLVTGLIAYFESRFLELADSFSATPYRFPTLISAKFLDRVNYFKAFPHSLSFVTHLREDLTTIDQFAQHTHWEGDALNASPSSFSRIEVLNSPAVCYHWYFSLADQQLKKDHLVGTAVGNCFRYESSNLTSLERLWNFTMREIIFIGKGEYVLEQRETGRQKMTKILEELGLAYQVESANDPFFIGEFRKQVAFQSAFQLKYEIRASLPFSGKTLAVGSYNYHQDFFGRNLNITLPDGSPIHTGCIAFGLERMAYAFLAQYGLDKKQWPPVVREGVR
jgi:seryl-tRNA synthetase